MPNQDYTHIEFLLDKSGSMSSLRNTVINGYNEFLQGNLEIPGRLTCSMRQFNTEHEDTYVMAEGNDIPKLSNSNFVPSGMTALIDAAVDSIDRLGEQLAELPEEERPGKVVFVVYTDGQENSSKYHSAPELSARIKEQEDLYKWEFVYLGAHPDAFGEAGNLGFDLRKVGGYQATQNDMARSFTDVSRSVTRYRKGESSEVLMDQN